MVVLKNAAQNATYLHPIQGKIEKVSNSSDFLTRIDNNICKNRGKHSESSVVKVADLLHVLHKDASVRADINLGIEMLRCGSA
jgi:hypothetical protein